MATTQFNDKSTVIEAEWLNEVDAIVHDIFGGATTDAEARTSLGLNSMAVQSAASVAITGGSISGVTLSSSNVTITGGSVSGITDLAIADGGTGASTAADARTNLGAASSTTTITSGTGISGGGDLSANRTLSLDINSLTAEVSVDGSSDYLALYDASAGALRKVTPSSLPMPPIFDPATAGGTGNDITATTGAPAYTTGNVYTILLTADNTGSATINLDSLGAKDIKLLNGDDPQAGDLKDGLVAQFVYDGTNMVLINAYAPSPSVRRVASVSASGTAVDFTGIPSWVKRITVFVQGVSTTGTSLVCVQIGDSFGVETSGYLAGAAGSVSTTTQTGAFPLIADTAATHVYHGSAVIENIASNVWILRASVGRSDSSSAYTAGGSKSLTGTLDRVRVTTLGGSDTFDAGNIALWYEA